MDEFKPNSHKSKAEANQKRAKKIVSGEVHIGDDNTSMRAIADAFIQEDAKTVKKYLLFDVLIPSLKNALYQLISSGAYMSLFGGKGAPPTKGAPLGAKYSYSDYYEQNNNRNNSSPASRYRPSYDDIVLDSAGEAEMVLDTMRQTIYEYGCVSVLQLFDMLGQDCDFTLDKYGWRDLSNASVQPTRNGGFRLRLPKPRPI